MNRVILVRGGENIELEQGYCGKLNHGGEVGEPGRPLESTGMK